jgi:hypothetical protein
MDDHINHLNKVSLSIRSINRSGQKVLELLPISTELIVGLNPEGLAPFECELMNKKTGDEIRLKCSRKNWRAMMGHISIPLPPETSQNDEAEIIVKIAKIDKPSNREVVKAMANLAGGCGSDCDCGCGH